LATVIYFWRGLTENNSQYYYLAGILAAVSSWTKNEGLFLSLIIILSFLVYLLVKKMFHFRFIAPLLIFIVLLLPWLVFRSVYSLGWGNVDAGWRLGWHPQIISVIFSRLFGTINWNIWWLIFGISLITFRRRLLTQENLFWLLSLLGVFGFYLVLYLFTPNASYITMGIVDQRNLLTIVPISVFYVGLLFSNNYDKI
jgi:hypothetical protein